MCYLLSTYNDHAWDILVNNMCESTNWWMHDNVTAELKSLCAKPVPSVFFHLFTRLPSSAASATSAICLEGIAYDNAIRIPKGTSVWDLYDLLSKHVTFGMLDDITLREAVKGMHSHCAVELQTVVAGLTRSELLMHIAHSYNLIAEKYEEDETF